MTARTFCGVEHTAAHKKKPGVLKDVYDYFSAAAEGCRQCVEAYVEEKLIPHNVRSGAGQFTALCWARYGQTTLDVDTSDVQRYLLHCAEREGLLTTPGMCGAATAESSGMAPPADGWTQSALVVAILRINSLPRAERVDALAELAAQLAALP